MHAHAIAPLLLCLAAAGFHAPHAPHAAHAQMPGEAIIEIDEPVLGPGTSAGMPDGGGYPGIMAGQPNSPVSGGTADPSDPIAFWRATFTAPTDQGPFTVGLSTLTTRFDVYIERESSRAEARLDGLTEGAGQITVVPAPASGPVLGLGLAAGRRRR